MAPEFAQELDALVRESEHPRLADQVGALPIVARCRCRQSDCAHFYTAPPPQGAYGPGHFSVPLAAKRGLIVLDVVGHGIVGVEVLGRADFKRVLDQVMPE
ncbi:MAG: hypothetical protein HY908_09710 [Myxococcales bacterium]|nr:hypothetical protein [Myxococcales bacterium]